MGGGKKRGLSNQAGVSARGREIYAERGGKS